MKTLSNVEKIQLVISVQSARAPMTKKCAKEIKRIAKAFELEVRDVVNLFGWDYEYYKFLFEKGAK